MTRKQRTLRTVIEFSGVGLHSGETVRARILPAPQDHGVEFVRTDLPDAAPIPAKIAFHSAKERRTRLERGNAHVDTVEHLLSVCCGLSIDNLTVELSGSEMPGLDGSALELMKLVQQAGVVEQAAEARVFDLDQPVYVREGAATLVALPTETPGLTLQYVASFEEPGVEGGSYQLELSPESFAREIAPARTFCLASEVEALQKAGFGKGATRENTVVLGDPSMTLRLPGEPVRHKVLDLLGDLYLIGRPIRGRILAHKSGHSLNHTLAKRLLEQDGASERAMLVKREAVLDIRRIQRILPHRYPMLLVDRVLEIDGDQRAVGVKNVTFNDIFFQGHYPGTPIMPGVLIVEAMAQLGGILLSQKLEHTGKLAVLLSMDKVKMRHPVVPGDQLLLEAITVRVKSRTGHVRCKAFVGEKLACEADIKFMLVDSEPL